jgi:hypothetical protein
VRCGQFPLLDVLFLEESRAQCKVPGLQCAAEAAGSILLVVPPVVGPFLCLDFDDCHREKCSVNPFLYFEFLYEKLFLVSL